MTIFVFLGTLHCLKKANKKERWCSPALFKLYNPIIHYKTEKVNPIACNIAAPSKNQRLKRSAKLCCNPALPNEG